MILMKVKILHALLGISVGVLLAFAVAVFRALVYDQKNPPLPTTELILAGETFRVELARSVGEMALGLSGREGLAEGDGSANSPHGGMLFIFDAPMVQSFWMKDMKFPIDIIWINGNRIVGFAENARPETGKKPWQLTIYSSPEPVDKVLEVAAGTVARLNVKVGDEVVIGFPP